MQYVNIHGRYSLRLCVELKSVSRVNHSVISSFVLNFVFAAEMTLNSVNKTSSSILNI